MLLLKKETKSCLNFVTMGMNKIICKFLTLENENYFGNVYNLATIYLKR